MSQSDAGARDESSRPSNEGERPPGSIAKRAVTAIRTKGVGHLVRSAYEIVSYKASTNAHLSYNRVFRSRRTYEVDGRTYRYFYHRHNRTWLNERTVEVPIAWDLVGRHRPDSVLEVGNVLSHYFPVSHAVVDKYERAPGVLNEDVVDFKSDKRYRLIVTISTLEHVGWDEDPHSKERVDLSDDKIVRAIRNLQGLLADDGEMLVTVPLGHNPILDSQIGEGAIPLESQRFLRRVSRNNTWEQAEWSECRGVKYGSPYTAANAIAVLRIRKHSTAPGKDGPSSSARREGATP